MKLPWIIAVAIMMLTPMSILAWTSGGPPLQDGDLCGVVADPLRPNVVYASDGDGFFRSDDAGAHWSPQTSTALTSVLTVDPSDPMNLYAGPSSAFPLGILRSTDGGTTWESNAHGLTCGPVLGIAVASSSPSVLYAVASDFPRTAAQCAGVFRSDDFGVGWSAVSDWNSEWIAVDPTTPDIAYVGVATFEFPGSVSYFIGRTIDGGANWEELPFIPFGAPGFGGAFAIDSTNPAHLYAFGTLPNVVTLTGAFYESNDRGNSWEILSNSDGSIFTSLVVDPASPKILFASSVGNNLPGDADHGGGVFRSGDGGHSWMPFGLENEPVASLAIDGQGRFLHASVVGKGIFDTATGRPKIIPVPVGGFPPRVRRLAG
jgi:hypothetical protein